jgi:hypothetical protein
MLNKRPQLPLRLALKFSFSGIFLQLLHSLAKQAKSNTESPRFPWRLVGLSQAKTAA